MRISNKLPQFNGQVALLVSAGKKEASFYIATEGFITSVRTIKVEPPKYSDREGFFAMRNKNGLLGSGAVYEKKKQKLNQEFIPKFSQALGEIAGEYKLTDLFLFAPAFLLNELKGKIPNGIKAKLRLAIGRHYFGRHPFKLLEKIKEKTEKPVMIDKPEVQKILKRRFLSPSGS